MTTRTRLVAALLAAGVLAPAAAQAVPVDLQGAPTLRQTGDREVRVRFAVADRLDRTRSGAPDARVAFSNQGRARVQADGRHGRDYRYAAEILATRELRAGERYTVHLEIPGGRSRTLRLTLLDAR